jgi:Uma2 family endonuclease
MVATQQLTAQDLWNLHDDLEDFELIEGTLLPMSPPNGEHGEIQAALIGAIWAYLADRNVGKVYGDVGYVLSHAPDTVLGPNLSFIASARIPADRKRFLPLAPDLAGEIVSPGNSPGEIERKVAIYLQAGTRMVWVIYPRQRQIVVHTPGEAPRVFTESDELPGGDVLPGLVLPVAGIFG